MTRVHSILNQRRAGALLHITSLPGGFGNGDLGRDAYNFINFLSDAGISVWQTLPIGPTHADGSPYQCMSAHAGNPLLIGLDWLVERGYLAELPDIDVGQTADRYRRDCLKRAFANFVQRDCEPGEQPEYDQFVAAHSFWLNDYALYIALRDECDHQPWQSWPAGLRDRCLADLESAQTRLAETVKGVKFEQFVFYQQWQELKAHAHARGVLLFGDMPIFVAADSADVWAGRRYFDLTEEGAPRVVAGVPPDYFSVTGQRWGNPHYNWKEMEADGFVWWIERLRGQLELYDWVRIDHFRGFEAYWEIPAEEETAMQGRWVKAPGQALLKKLYDTFPGERLPLVAENLGIITPEVEAMRTDFAIPGMLILQFAFDGGPGNPYLPHNHDENNVVYTGTHDNDTTLSWYETLPQAQQHYVYQYLGLPEVPMPRALIQCAMASVARLAILPMQDILELGREHRMNIPGEVNDYNWRWRFAWDQVSDEKKTRLRQLIELYGRI